MFSKVALVENLPEYHLKWGDIAVIVEHYPMSDGQEDGYSLEGWDVPCRKTERYKKTEDREPIQL